MSVGSFGMCCCQASCGIVWEQVMVYVAPQRLFDLVNCAGRNYDPANPNRWQDLCTDYSFGFTNPKFSYSEYNVLQDAAYSQILAVDFDNPPVPFTDHRHDWGGPDNVRWCPNIRTIIRYPVWNSVTKTLEYQWLNGTNAPDVNSIHNPWAWPSIWGNGTVDIGYVGPMAGTFFSWTAAAEWGTQAVPNWSQYAPDYAPFVLSTRVRLSGYGAACTSRRTFYRISQADPEVSNVLECSKKTFTPNSSGSQYEVDAQGRVIITDNIAMTFPAGDWDQAYYGYSGTVPWLTYSTGYGPIPGTGACNDCSCSA